jgi:DNA-binding GntR family transcriptional regulator
MNHPKTDEELAYERLRQAFVNGDLPIGEFLSQRKLAEIAGVSVITVRGALRMLERDGLVENVPRWGVRIPVETEARVRDRYFMRELLELAAVRRLASGDAECDPWLLRDLARRCDSMAGSGDPEDLAAFAQAHFDLHHAIAACSGSPLLVETLDRVFYRTMMLFDTRMTLVDRDSYNVRHVPLVEDLLCGDPALAERSMRHHIETGLQYELEAVRNQSTASYSLVEEVVKL